MPEQSIEYAVTSHAERSHYRQPVAEMLPHLRLPLTSENTDPMPSALLPTPQIHFDQAISLILPLEYYDYEQCLLIYQDSIALVTRRSSAIIQMILSHYHHFDHRIYKETMNLMLTQQPSTRQYKTPIATSEYSLFPLTNAKSPATIWLNPASVQSLSAGAHETIVQLFNNISFRSPLEPRSVRNNMYTNFIAHAIMKRDFTPTVVQENMSLYEYLHLPYSIEITKIIQNTSYADIPGKRGSFMAYYFSIFYEHADSN